MKKTTTTAFENLLTDFERAYAVGEYSAELTALAIAIAYSVLNKVADPTRHTAAKPRKDGTPREKFDKEIGAYIVSNSGNNPAILAIKHGLTDDIHTLSETAYTVEHATKLAYNGESDTWEEVTDDTAAAGYVRKIMSATLSDGTELVDEIIVAILAAAEEHANEANWLTKEIAVRRLDKRVYIRMDDSAAYRDDITTPLQEIYRHARRYVDGMGSVKADTGKYLYIDGEDPDTLERIYYRLGKYTDVGSDSGYGYTADEHTALDMANTLEKLNLTARQAEVLSLRLKGYGYKAIATYLGVTQRAIAKTCEGIQKKAISTGLVTAENVGQFADRPERKPTNTPHTAPTAHTVNHWNEMENVNRVDVLEEITTAIMDEINPAVHIDSAALMECSRREWLAFLDLDERETYDNHVISHREFWKTLDRETVKKLLAK